jgi:hypothetical protein
MGFRTLRGRTVRKVEKGYTENFIRRLQPGRPRLGGQAVHALISARSGHELFAVECGSMSGPGAYALQV